MSEEKTVDFTSYLNDESAIVFAKELAEHIERFKGYDKLKTTAEKELVGSTDCQYDMSGGKMVGENANTWFSFDLNRDSTLYTFMKAMFARETKDEEEEAIRDFLATKVGGFLSANHADVVREVIRSISLKDSDPRTFPLSKIDLLDVELVDYSSVESEDKRTVNYIKLPGVSINMKNVMARIHEVRDEYPKMSTNDIIIKERKAANPIFDAVMGATVGSKFLWECHLSFCVDYSFSEEFLAIQQKVAAEQKGKAEERKEARRKESPLSILKDGKKTVRRLI
jgi:hypothetical protein